VEEWVAPCARSAPVRKFKQRRKACVRYYYVKSPFSLELCVMRSAFSAKDTYVQATPMWFIQASEGGWLHGSLPPSESRDHQQNPRNIYDPQAAKWCSRVVPLCLGL
jgi:hypothetical protein